MPSRSISVRAQVLLVLVSLVLACTATLGALAYRRERRDVESHAFRLVGIAADTRYNMLLDRLSARTQQAKAALAATNQECRSRREATLACYTRELDQEAKTLGADAAWLGFPGGTSVATGQAGKELSEVALPEGVAARFFARPEGRYYVVSARDSQRRTVKFQFRTHWVDWLFTEPRELGRSGSSFLTDEQGRLVVAPGDNAPDAPAGQVLSASTRRCLSGASGEQIAPDYRNVNSVEAFRFMPQIGGGCLVATITTAEVLEPLRAFRRELLLGVGLFTIVAIGLALLLARVVTGPIERLRGWVQALEGGNFEVRIRPEGPREIRGLAQAFRLMAASLRDSYAQLTRAHEELEERVKQRTRQLRETQAQLEDRLVQLQEANTNLEAFNYSVSHDLRSPLRAMETMGALLTEHLGDRLDERGRDYLGRITAAAKQLDQLTQDLLDYSQMGRERMPLEPVELRPVVCEVLQRLAPEIRETGAEIELKEWSERAAAYQPALETALANLVRNAIKFVEPGVRPRLRIWAEPRNGFVRVSVQDNGIGIAPEYHDRIFRLFERLHLPENYPGTGVGLAIVREAVGRMGGSTGVESAPGKGSRFWFDLREAA